MRALAFSVHILTACGAALALLALLAATHGDWPLMFLWLGVALVVDAVDGPLARAANVAEVLPRWSGETLDLVVDYTTYVFVPAYAIAAGGLMQDAWAVTAGLAIAVTGTLYFANREMKTSGQFLPRLSGGVEPGRVLSPAAAAGARDLRPRRWRCSPF